MNFLDLEVCEKFVSLEGEGRFKGFVTSFVRLSGCNLRCSYCDTKYAWKRGRKVSIDSLVKWCIRNRTRVVHVTGGEPMLQKNVMSLLSSLLDIGFTVLLDTNGTFDLGDVPDEVHRIIDIKGPGSGNPADDPEVIIDFLRGDDELKMVVTDREDYLFYKKLITSYSLDRRCEVVMSPAYRKMRASVLAGWILKDRLPVRFSMQQHKSVGLP